MAAAYSLNFSSGAEAQGFRSAEVLLRRLTSQPVPEDETVNRTARTGAAAVSEPAANPADVPSDGEAEGEPAEPGAATLATQPLTTATLGALLGSQESEQTGNAPIFARPPAATRQEPAPLPAPIETLPIRNPYGDPEDQALEFERQRLARPNRVLSFLSAQPVPFAASTVSIVI